MKVATQTFMLEKFFDDKEAVKILCELGYDSIDYSFFTGSKGIMKIEQEGRMNELAELKKLADSYGVTFNQTHAPFPSYKEGDDEYNSWVKPLIIKSIEASSILGAKCVVIHPFTVEKDQKQANMDFFNSLLPYAEKYNVQIAIENMFGWNNETKTHYKNVCSDAASMCDYIDTLNSEYVVACLDIGHCGLVGEDAAKMIYELGPKRLQSLHVHDNNFTRDQHTMPFTEKIDFPKVMKALHDIEYVGEITLEMDFYIGQFPKELAKDVSLFMYRIAKYLAKLGESSEE